MSHLSGAVWVDLHNPNTTFGLLRTDVALTAEDAAGNVLEVFEGPLPGAPCCTIYRLPPGADYLMAPSFSHANAVKKVEARLKGQWQLWSDVMSQLPLASITGAKLAISKFVGAEKDIKVTGRVQLDAGGGPFNVQVNVDIEGSNGFLYLLTDVACVTGTSAVPFEASDLQVPPSGAHIGRIWAETTTVPSVTSPDQPPGC